MELKWKYQQEFAYLAPSENDVMDALECFGDKDVPGGILIVDELGCVNSSKLAPGVRIVKWAVVEPQEPVGYRLATEDDTGSKVVAFDGRVSVLGTLEGVATTKTGTVRYFVKGIEAGYGLACYGKAFVKIDAK